MPVTDYIYGVTVSDTDNFELGSERDRSKAQQESKDNNYDNFRFIYRCHLGAV